MSEGSRGYQQGGIVREWKPLPEMGEILRKVVLQMLVMGDSRVGKF